jgi:hypothetical protein
MQKIKLQPSGSGKGLVIKEGLLENISLSRARVGTLLCIALLTHRMLISIGFKG